MYLETGVVQSSNTFTETPAVRGPCPLLDTWLKVADVSRSLTYYSGEWPTSVLWTSRHSLNSRTVLASDRHDLTVSNLIIDSVRSVIW